MQILKRLLIGLALVTTPALLINCAGPDADESEALGQLRMNLTSSSSSGTTYRLTGAQFQITAGGAVVETLLSDSFANQTAASTQLSAGSYEVELLENWQLLRVDETQDVPVEATLVSSSVVPFQIAVDGVTHVSYQFRFAAEDIVFGNGDLQISFNVEEIPANWTCPAGWFNDTYCDCGCGALDPTCSDPSAEIYGCAAGEYCGSDAQCHSGTCGDGILTPDEDCDGTPGCPGNCNFVPETWTCPASYWSDSYCDCECGAYDLDCNDPALPTEGCEAGEVCSNAGVCVLPVPETWTCDSRYFNANDGCDCNCGVEDPDCDEPSAEIFGCEGAEICVAGECVQP